MKVGQRVTFNDEKDRDFPALVTFVHPPSAQREMLNLVYVDATGAIVSRTSIPHYAALLVEFDHGPQEIRRKNGKVLKVHPKGVQRVPGAFWRD